MAAMEAKEVAVVALRLLRLNGWGRKVKGPPKVEKTTASMKGNALREFGSLKGQFFRRKMRERRPPHRVIERPMRN